MAQLPHFETEADGTATAITNGLEAGCYIAMPRGPGGGVGVLYATRADAPTDPDDYFQCRAGDQFVFRVGTGIPPTWVRNVPGAPAVSVARARTE